jgi:hypothetical protein
LPLTTKVRTLEGNCPLRTTSHYSIQSRLGYPRLQGIFDMGQELHALTVPGNVVSMDPPSTC